MRGRTISSFTTAESRNIKRSPGVWLLISCSVPSLPRSSLDNVYLLALTSVAFWSWMISSPHTHTFAPFRKANSLTPLNVPLINATVMALSKLLRGPFLMSFSTIPIVASLSMPITALKVFSPFSPPSLERQTTEPRQLSPRLATARRKTPLLPVSLGSGVYPANAPVFLGLYYLDLYRVKVGQARYKNHR